MEFSLSTFCLPQSTLPLSGLHVVLQWCFVDFFVCQPPSNSLFVAVTDYRTLLFCFDSTRHSYCTTLRRLNVGGREIYTDYVIASKETSLGIAGIFIEVIFIVLLIIHCFISLQILRRYKIFYKKVRAHRTYFLAVYCSIS